MEGVLDQQEIARLKVRLGYLAWRRYGLAEQVTEDLVQAALLTFLEVRDRYPNREEHTRILVGIFRNKCREHIDEQVRTQRKVHRFRATLEAGELPPAIRKREADAKTDVLSQLVQVEDQCVLRQALAELRPPAREMFRLITEKGMTRRELIEHYQINKNTLDSRLHSYRRELRKILRRRGLGS